jgi:hypothetical protein
MSTNSELACMLLSLRRAYSVDDTRMNDMAQWWNNIVRGKPENSEKYLSQCDPVHHKSHTEQRDIDLRRAGPAINHLSHGTNVTRKLARDLKRISLTTEFTDGLREQYDVKLWWHTVQLHKHIGLRISVDFINYYTSSIEWISNCFQTSTAAKIPHAFVYHK